MRPHCDKYTYFSQSCATFWSFWNEHFSSNKAGQFSCWKWQIQYTHLCLDFSMGSKTILKLKEGSKYRDLIILCSWYITRYFKSSSPDPTTNFQFPIFINLFWISVLTNPILTNDLNFFFQDNSDWLNNSWKFGIRCVGSGEEIIRDFWNIWFHKVHEMSRI